MISKSTSEAVTRLREYLAWIDNWDPECGDAFVMLNAREWLAANRDVLSAADSKALAKADVRLLAIAGQAVGNTPSIEFLRLTAQAVMAA